MKNLTIIVSLSLFPILTSCSRADKAASYNIADPQQQVDHTHAAFNAILAKHVKKELVDYAGLKKSSAPLNAYLDTLAAVPESAFNKWDKKQQMAFLINLYNAATLKLIVDHYPIKSIKDIGSALKGPWKHEIVRLFGKIETLDHIEHNLLRPKYEDPRVHFGVNCASIGCPPLRAEAFQASKLDAQLDEQARIFLRDTSKNRLDAKNKTLYLSKIFDWFKGDFTAESGTVEKFASNYVTDSDRKVIQQGGLTIKNTEYDWNLNKQ
ncbi:MAG: DUF547 domain-containing protein [Luteolibacter sp.]